MINDFFPLGMIYLCAKALWHVHSLSLYVLMQKENTYCWHPDHVK